MAQSDIHLKLDGIKGESTSARHKDEIDVESWTWGVAKTAPAPGGGGGAAGRATFADLTFAHRVDRASPELWKACATGKHVKDATLSVARAGAAAQDYVTVKMTDVIVTAAALADTAADALPPLETVSLRFAKVDYEYRPQKPDGSLGAAVAFKFDIAQNKVG